MSWFARSSELKSDSPQQLHPYQAWPPTFQTFEEYKNELETAINEHPPFGEWLKKYRNKKHVLNCNALCKTGRMIFYVQICCKGLILANFRENF